MKRFVCIHGHFYQPPRENPWLEEVESEDTAYPYHDWNQRITAECYAPNMASRILNNKGQIINIFNNYARMSFNFGPTLLSWLEKKEPEVYHAILEADKKSCTYFDGHGSALAQAYNHTILPLMPAGDKRTQILWGLQDFTHRFGRDPEGMWLPETAVDLETLDILSEVGIRFTILAPHQAARIRRLKEKKWRSVSGESLETRQSYLCRMPSGRSIALYFYEGALARDVAFWELLKTGQGFAERLQAGFSLDTGRSELMHIATDGETYGHHHRFGEMALSYALHHLESQQNVCLTNYAAYLAGNPPEYEVEINENTSWSCVHGIERWRTDCGCSSGGHPGWSQAWRGPLYTAMAQLQKNLNRAYEKAIRSFGCDPWMLRDEYIRVLLDGSEKNRHIFLSHFELQDLALERRRLVWKWLELQRCLQMMFTSCGWFFDDVSGIESRQVMRYAARAMQLARELGVPDPEPAYLNHLRKAPSNHSKFSHAAEIYEARVRPAVLDLRSIGAHHAVAAVFLEPEENQGKSSYALNIFGSSYFEGKGQKLATGHLRLKMQSTEEQLGLSFAALYLGGHDVQAAVAPEMSERTYQEMEKALRTEFETGNTDDISRLQDRFLGPERFGLPHLFKDTKREIVNHLLNSILNDFEEAMLPFYQKDLDFIQAAHRMNVPLPAVLSQAFGFSRHRKIYRMLEQGNPDIERLDSFAEQINSGIFDLDDKTMSMVLSRTLERMLVRIEQDPEDHASLQLLVAFIRVIQKLPLVLNLWKSQNLLFHLWKHRFEDFKSLESAEDKKSKIRMKHLHQIGDFLKVSLDP